MTVLRVGEYKCKWNKWQRINLKNAQAARVAQYQKNKQPNQKMGRTKQTFLQRRNPDGQKNTYKDAQLAQY